MVCIPINPAADSERIRSPSEPRDAGTQIIVRGGRLPSNVARLFRVDSPFRVILWARQV
jgi:hypothetical protein